MAGKKVQVDLSENAHKRLRRLARRTKQTIPSLIRGAIEDHMRRRTPLEEDSLFGLIGHGTLEEGTWSEGTRWRG